MISHNYHYISSQYSRTRRDYELIVVRISTYAYTVALRRRTRRQRQRVTYSLSDCDFYSIFCLLCSDFKCAKK